MSVHAMNVVRGEATLQPPAVPVEQVERKDEILVKNLVVSYESGPGEHMTAVDGVSFTLKQGEFVSIIGPSGCGKTTVLNLLAGLINPTFSGEMLVRGHRGFAGDPDIAYMLARDSLLPWRTTLQNAEYGMELRGVPSGVRRAKALQMLSQVGLGDFVNSYPKALSHGMRQRCALARTFALDSAIFLMDEPFGALDAQTKFQLEDVLLDLWSQHRRTVVFITHDLAEAVALSDRVIVMSHRPGRIVADVPIDLPRPRSVRDLQKEPRFHALYSSLWSHLETKGLQ
jgi:NitT/TauT family transport system ATP-binding protein